MEKELELQKTTERSKDTINSGPVHAIEPMDPQNAGESHEATIVKLRLDAVHDLLLKIKHMHPRKDGQQASPIYKSNIKSSPILPDQYLDFLNYVPSLPINFPDYQNIQYPNSNRSFDGPKQRSANRSYNHETTNMKTSFNQRGYEADATYLGNSMNSITALINNFLEFIRTRCEIVYREYDEYHQLLKKLLELGSQDGSLRERLENIFLRGREDLCGELFDGEEILRAFRGVVLKGISDLSNLVDKRIADRRQILLYRRQEVEELYDDYLGN